MREVYSDTDQHEKKINHAWAYQAFSNLAHPNLEPSAIFYSEGTPPSEMFSSVGALRLTFSLFVVTSSVNEMVVNVFIHDKPLVEDIYADRKKVFDLHDEATQLLDSNPSIRPQFHRNEKLRIGWKDGKPILTMNA